MRDLAITIELVAKDVRDDENVGVDLLAYATQEMCIRDRSRRMSRRRGYTKMRDAK